LAVVTAQTSVAASGNTILRIVAALHTVIEELPTGSGARREVILYRTASERPREISVDKGAISGVTTASAIAEVLAIEAALVIVAIVVV